MHKTIEAEQLWLTISRAIGIDVPAIDYDATDTPTCCRLTPPGPWPRCGLGAHCPRPVSRSEEEDVSAFICPRPTSKP